MSSFRRLVEGIAALAIIMAAAMAAFLSPVVVVVAFVPTPKTTRRTISNCRIHPAARLFLATPDHENNSRFQQQPQTPPPLQQQQQQQQQQPTREQQEQLDKYGPTPETSMEILFDSLLSGSGGDGQDFLNQTVGGDEQARAHWENFLTNMKDLKGGTKSQRAGALPGDDDEDQED